MKQPEVDSASAMSDAQEGPRVGSDAAARAYMRRKEQHATTAYAIRMPCGLYFAGFADPRKDPNIKVKWRSGLCEARLFGGNCYAQAEKYVERIKAKDSLYVGPKIIEVRIT